MKPSLRDQNINGNVGTHVNIIQVLLQSVPQSLLVFWEHNKDCGTRPVSLDQGLDSLRVMVAGSLAVTTTQWCSIRIRSLQEVTTTKLL